MDREIERERERKRVSIYIYIYICLYVCVCVCEEGSLVIKDNHRLRKHSERGNHPQDAAASLRAEPHT